MSAIRYVPTSPRSSVGWIETDNVLIQAGGPDAGRVLLRNYAGRMTPALPEHLAALHESVPGFTAAVEACAKLGGK